MSFLQSILVFFVIPALSLLIFLVFAQVIFSWLLAFNIVNLRNPIVSQIYQAINMIMAPMMRPIQRVLPSFGGLDFSPIVVLLGLYWARDWLVPMAAQMIS